MKYIKVFRLVAIPLIFVESVFAQESDSIKSKLTRQNIVKFNLSSTLLYSPNFVVSYERVFSPNKSFSVEAGYISFPISIGSLSDNFEVSENVKRAGFKVDVDYRFYFKKENKFNAPHGLYWGPYAAYYYFKNERKLVAIDSAIASGSFLLNSSLSIPQVGIELGYQFSLLKDRMAIDLLLAGPALSLYSAKMSLAGDYNIDNENEYLNDLLKLLLDNFPVIGDLIEGQEVSQEGVANVFTIGYRYSVSVGYRF